MRLSWPVCCPKWLPEGRYPRSPVQLVPALWEAAAPFTLPPEATHFPIWGSQRRSTWSLSWWSSEACMLTWRLDEHIKLLWAGDHFLAHLTALRSLHSFTALEVVTSASQPPHPTPCHSSMNRPCRGLRFGGLLRFRLAILTISEATWDLCLCPCTFVPLYKSSYSTKHQKPVLPPSWQSEETGKDGPACCLIQPPGKHLLSQKGLRLYRKIPKCNTSGRGVKTAFP